jgi:hypothetical protein
MLLEHLSSFLTASEREIGFHDLLLPFENENIPKKNKLDTNGSHFGGLVDSAEEL